MAVAKKILVVDNYDSFVFNLVQYLGELGADIDVVRNDKISVDEISERSYEGIVISPGPGKPSDAGICIEVIQKLGGSVPIFGVCLGHQAIAEAFGAKVIRAPHPMHGKTSSIAHTGSSVFSNVENPFRATRYHSLIVDEATLPAFLEITARSEDGLVMGLAHRSLPIHGVQFHPESIYTTLGKQIVANFLSLCQPFLLVR